MGNNSPLFSIIMPTRDRGHLLRHALTSVMAQTFDDYEVVVSDNSSTDDTPAVVKELADGNVRYVRTPGRLSMPDSWDFALNSARGQYVGYVSDDDAVSSRLLECASAALQKNPSPVISWAAATYYHSTLDNASLRSTFVIFPFTGRLYSFNSATHLQKLFALRNPLSVPMMLNSFCHREVINSVRKDLGRFFLPPCPDWSSCALMLAMTQRYTFIDIPLKISGNARESNGRSLDATFAFSNEFDPSTLFQHMPLQKVLTNSNGVAETLLRVKKEIAGRYPNLILDRVAVYTQYHQDLLYLQNLGLDITEALAELFAALEREPKTIQQKVQKGMRARAPLLRSIQNSMKKTLRPIIRRSTPLSHIEASIRQRIFAGEQAHLPTMSDAVKHLDSLLGADGMISRFAGTSVLADGAQAGVSNGNS